MKNTKTPLENEIEARMTPLKSILRDLPLSQKDKLLILTKYKTELAESLGPYIDAAQASTNAMLKRMWRDVALANAAICSAPEQTADRVIDAYKKNFNIK